MISCFFRLEFLETFIFAMTIFLYVETVDRTPNNDLFLMCVFCLFSVL